MQSGAGLLRLDTDLGPRQEPLASHGIPTPISAGVEERKSSLSSWSFLTQPSQHGSQPSSVSSFPSCPEPSTPEHHGLSLEYPSFSGTGSFEDLSTSVRSSGHGPSYQDAAYFQNSPPGADSGIGLADSQWKMIPRTLTASLYRSQSHGVSEVVSSCGSFSNSLAASLVPSPLSFGIVSTECSVPPWSQSSFGQPTMATEHEDSHHTQQAYIAQNFQYPWPLPVRNVLPSNAHAQVPTIVPSDAMPAVFDFGCHETQEFSDIEFKDGMTFPSAVKIEPRGYFGCEEMDEDFENGSYTPIKRESFQEGKSYRRPAGICKGNKKFRYSNRHPGKKRKCETAAKILKLQDGRETLGSTTGGKQHRCKQIREDGTQCSGKFHRIEHLKRHEKIHDEFGEVFMCPLPEEFKPDEKKVSSEAHGKIPKCPCRDGLSRRDNWRDHLKTHLRPSAAGRNKRVVKEILYKALREQESKEEAEKTIRILEEHFAREEKKRGAIIPKSRSHCNKAKV